MGVLTVWRETGDLRNLCPCLAVCDAVKYLQKKQLVQWHPHPALRGRGRRTESSRLVWATERPSQNGNHSRALQLTPVIPATEEAEIRRFEASLGKQFFETLSQKKPITKKGW
jgi:hypothetical protein